MVTRSFGEPGSGHCWFRRGRSLTDLRRLAQSSKSPREIEDLISAESVLDGRVRVKIVDLVGEQSIDISHDGCSNFSYFVHCLSGEAIVTTARLGPTDLDLEKLKEGEIWFNGCGMRLRHHHLRGGRYGHFAHTPFLFNVAPTLWLLEGMWARVIIVTVKTDMEIYRGPEELSRMSSVWRTKPSARPLGISLKSLFVGTVWEDYAGYEYVRLDPGARVTPHIHRESDALVFVTSGSGSFLTHDAEIKVMPGCYGEIPRGRYHAVKAGPRGMTFISMQAPPIGTDYVEMPVLEAKKDVVLAAV